MPLYSDHIANMYYGASPSYSSLPYGYNSSVSSHGPSYSASYLNPGGSYTSHSSLGGYSRTPLTSRWISGIGRNYSPMLNTITERGSASPVRINSPRRMPVTTRNYGTSTYTPRPININTADIDVSKDKYRHKLECIPTNKPPQTENKNIGSKTGNGPFMPRVDNESETGVDSTPSTLKRGRTVVRLYTIKRKERDSPRKPQENSQAIESINVDGAAQIFDNEPQDNKKETMKWREKLSDDLAYNDKKEKKSLGSKLMEKFTVKETTNNISDIPTKVSVKQLQLPENSSEISPSQNTNIPTNVSLDRRCSMELLAEQASLFDSLIRSENLSTVPLDLSKVGIIDELKENSILKRRTLAECQNPLKTTKSDHSLHDNLKAYKDVKGTRKRRSIKKSASGGSICRLDSITEFPKEPINIDLPAIEEVKLLKQQEITYQKPKPKLKTKITSHVEVSEISTPKSPLKFRVENVIIENIVAEEKPRTLKKEITYSSEVEEISTPVISLEEQSNKNKEQYKIKKKSNKETTVLEGDPVSPEPTDGNFWDKIGKRETVYLIKRKQNIEETNEKHKRALFWFPEQEESGSHEELSLATDNEIIKTNTSVSDIHSENDHTIYTAEVDQTEVHNSTETVENNCDEKSAQINTYMKDAEKSIFSKQNIKKTDDEKSKIVVNKKAEQNSIKEERVPLSDQNIIINDTERKSADKIIEKVAEVQFEECEIKCETKITLPVEEGLTAKRASLGIINDNKDKISINKKTKSEKIKKIRNNEQSCEKSDIKPSQCLFSKHSGNEKTENKSANMEICANIKSNTGLHLSKPSSIVKEKSQLVIDKTQNIMERMSNELTSENSFKIQLNSKDSSKESLSNKTEETTLKTRDLIDFKDECITLPVCETSKNTPNHNEPSKKDIQALSLKNNIKVTQYVPNNNKELQLSSQKETVGDTEVPSTAIESKDIPIEIRESISQVEFKKIGDKKAENIIKEDAKPDISDPVLVPQLFIPKRPVKEEKAPKPLIATPRPLQKRVPQVIHSSDSSEDESSEDDESETSEESAELIESENNMDGRISTGSNDSGFDSSAPTSPATFLQIRKDCDVNCHRKCEKLTANLCGVNQRLLVEALASKTASKKGVGDNSGASSSKVPVQYNNTDILEQEFEQSTAYDLFKKTGRFTPPAQSIPRFRKYTIEDFQFIKVLGKGSFGKVLLAELRDTEYYYAVKCLKKDVVLEDDDVECTLIERKVLALGTNHPYLCHLFATFQTDSHLFFVMEYLNGGDLMFHIQQSGRFPEARARFYAAEIVSGLKFLHKRGIVYRDLKLDNILLDFEGHVRIADFGMCKLQIYLDKTADTFCGTPDYMAPEIIKGLKYNQTVDWWSFGVLLYEMLIGQSPFSGCDEDELFWSICNEMPSYPRFLSQEALTILTRLLDKDARTRLGGTECMHGEIRDQDFFHPIHWDRLERRELETPFRPRVRHPMDTQYFDRTFTGERPRLTAVEPQVLRSMDQEPFRGFSYTNPNTTDR